MIPRRITRRFTQLMEANIERLLLILGEHHKETHGISEADIQAKEQSLGFPLPTTREYYKILGRSHISPKGVITNMNRSCCRTCSFLMILFTTDKAFLVFYQVEESVIYCGIRIQDLEQKDPRSISARGTYPTGAGKSIASTLSRWQGTRSIRS